MTTKNNDNSNTGQSEDIAGFALTPPDDIETNCSLHPLSKASNIAAESNNESLPNDDASTTNAKLSETYDGPTLLTITSDVQ